IVLYDATTRWVAVAGFNEAVLQSRVDAEFLHASALAGLLPLSAPEQTGRLGRPAYNRADYHALGALLYWALAGHAPFGETEPHALLHALLTRVPAPLDALNAAVSPELSAVVAKLLAKQPEQRYQSARGLRMDLERCLVIARRPADENEGAPPPEPFKLGADDRRIRPTPPSRLFGRELALRRLEAALQSGGGEARVAMVRGYAGTGKSALVRALYPAVTLRGGIVAAGRYDPNRRLAPFTGIASALDDLAHYWLADDPATLADTRERLLAALGPHAGFLARVAPAFATLFWRGEAIPAAPDDGTDSLQHMKQALHGVFQLVRERGTTLLLFIDDLQWADTNSFDLLSALALDAGLAPVLLVGAYRDNEVDATHPLTELLQKIE
ncbi:MAG: AAA family ATPase, partial [Solirubrobacteraceae bacterium]|nr:AAA family ATPase [Solirubrobacteraceae bacterium]